jgi:hypothetical protein
MSCKFCINDWGNHHHCGFVHASLVCDGSDQEKVDCPLWAKVGGKRK